jgi:ComF family protein
MKLLQHIGQSFSHLFFPQVCHGCGSDVVGDDQLLCLQCLHRLPYTRYQLHAENPVEKIFRGRVPLAHAAGIFYLTKNSILERLLYQLKYNGKKEIGEYCGRLMGHAMQSSPFTSIDALVPLPLFPKKERMRGYNQSAVICDGIASVIHKPVWKNVIERTATTETQTRKNRIERWQNMEGRFRVRDAAKLSGRHVLLVDDVITTGATLESCGSELVVAGVSVSILTLACAASKTV